MMWDPSPVTPDKPPKLYPRNSPGGDALRTKWHRVFSSKVKVFLTEIFQKDYSP